MGDTGSGLGEAADLGGGEVDAVRAPHVAVEPAERVEVLDRRAAVELLAVRLLLDRLREVGVQLQAQAAGEVSRLGHQPARDGERRARRDCDLDPGAGAGLVQLADESFRVGEHGVDLLDELVRRQAAVGDAEVHRAARGDDAAAELRAACTSASTSPVRPRGKT